MGYYPEQVEEQEKNKENINANTIQNGVIKEEEEEHKINDDKKNSQAELGYIDEF